MRVLLVDPSSRGGIAAYTAILAKALRAVDVDCIVLASRGLPEPVRGRHGSQHPAAGLPLSRQLPVEPWGRPEGAGVGFFARRASTWVRAAAVIYRAARQADPDVIHFQAPVNRRLDAQLVRLLARSWPVVWTAHDVLPYENTEADRHRFAAIYRAASTVIVHTEPGARKLRALAGVEPVVIEHPVPDDIVRVPQHEARARLGLPIDGRLLCALGFIRAYKGYGLLADVWERLGNAAPRLLVMGEVLAEQERPTVSRLARCPRVELRLGYANEHDLRLAVCAADALLLPYSTASDSGLLHLARASGVPVIASEAPQLAAAVRASGGGAVLSRDVETWSRAVTGKLPAPPPPPPDNALVGAKHRAVYERAVARQPPHLVFYTDADERGGAEAVLADLVADLDPAIDVTVMGVDPGVVKWIARGRPAAGTCVVPPVHGKRDLSAQAAHWRALRRLRPTVFQANLRHPWSCQYGIAAALLTPGSKVIAVEHLITPPTAVLQRRLKRITSLRLHAHVAVGHRSARALEGLVGLRAGSIRVIHNGLASSDAAEAKSEPTQAQIVAVGRLTSQKGFDVLLRALVDLPGVQALLIGEGPERRRLERLRDELALHERVRLPGWADDTASVVATADVLVLPSRFEGLPLVILEAMHAGVPVVATDVGSIREAVIEGRTGQLVAPDDAPALAAAIASVLEPATRERMAAQARQVARQRFTRERMKRDYELLYRELLC